MSEAANRVVKNSSILYIKMAISVALSLYTTRIVLNSLGIIDFGIYNLVAGIITMLAFLNTAMTTSTQRYMSFYQGVGSEKASRDIFGNSLLLHLLLSVLLIIVCSILGSFLFDEILDIPEKRILASKYVYIFAMLTVVNSILAVPFMASLNAHEDMLWVAIVGILEIFLKLVIAIYISFYEGDRLIFYGVGLTLISLISLSFYALLCLYKYSECTLNIRKTYNKYLMKELSSFAGWNTFGALCSVGKTQGMAVLFNVFMGATINAAYGIANQVSGQMYFFSGTMLKALNPQIMKSEGDGERDRMLRLSIMASKFGFFLLSIVAIPIIFEMSSILNFWLKKTPEYASVFCILTLISIIVNQLTIGLQSAVQAIGKVKIYQSVVGTILLLNLPISYLLLLNGINVYFTLFSAIVIEIIAVCFRLFFLKKMANLSIKYYFEKVLLKVFPPTLIATMLCFVIVNISDFQYRFLLTTTLSVIVFGISVYFLGLDKTEKMYIDKIITKITKII